MSWGALPASIMFDLWAAELWEHWALLGCAMKNEYGLHEFRSDRETYR